MSIIIFLIIIAALIFVHELGHFLAAKAFGIRVDEFALGFPPTIFQKKVGETTYKLNIIPFGGYVSIFGENPDEESMNGPDKGRSMVNKPRPVQAAVLVSGIFFNILFAWLLISLSLALGISPLGTISSNKEYTVPGKIIITDLVKNSPAEKAGFKAGDVVYKAEIPGTVLENEKLQIPAVEQLISNDKSGQLISFSIYRDKEMKVIDVMPQAGIINDQPAIGIAMESTDLIRVPWYKAPWEGAKATGRMIAATAVGLYMFASNAFTGHADFKQVSGPVGIVGLVGQASRSGFSYLLFFTSLISINLAVINFIPFPALDGGRLFFILIESIIRRPISPKIANSVNTVGFVLLLLLMVVITYNDIVKLFH